MNPMLKPTQGDLARSSRHGFTLIEMLVVISFIALIIAFLVPSMSWAKYRARTAQCVSNKHQIVVGMRSYATDNVNRFPNAQGSSNQYWMQDHPHIIFTAPRKWYGVPLELWACSASEKPKIPYHWGGYNPSQKWKMADSAWWVIRGSIGSTATLNSAKPNLVSDRAYQVASTGVIVSESIGGTTAPTSAPHAYGGKVLEGAVGRADGSSELILAGKMQIRLPSEGWGPWWY